MNQTVLERQIYLLRRRANRKMFEVIYIPTGMQVIVYATAIFTNNFVEETRFLVWDNKWRWYPADLFKPASEES